MCIAPPSRRSRFAGSSKPQNSIARTSKGGRHCCRPPAATQSMLRRPCAPGGAARSGAHRNGRLVGPVRRQRWFRKTLPPPGGPIDRIFTLSTDPAALACHCIGVPSTQRGASRWLLSRALGKATIRSSDDDPLAVSSVGDRLSEENPKPVFRHFFPHRYQSGCLNFPCLFRVLPRKSGLASTV